MKQLLIRLLVALRLRKPAIPWGKRVYLLQDRHDQTVRVVANNAFEAVESFEPWKDYKAVRVEATGEYFDVFRDNTTKQWRFAGGTDNRLGMTPEAQLKLLQHNWR